MRIGIICPYNMHRGGGVQECVLALASGLTDRGHVAKIITPMPRKRSHDISHKNVLYIGGATEIKSPFHTTAQISAVQNNEVIDELLAKEKFDLLHFHEPWVPMLSRQILTRSTVPSVATFHATLPESVMSRTIEKVITPYTKSLLNYLDGFTAVSDAAASYAKSLTDKTINIIPNGIDLKKYKPLKKQAKNRSIVYIGRLEKRKGVRYLIQAYALLIKSIPDVELIIAGDGPDRVKLENLAEELTLNQVRFVGYVSESEKLKLLGEATIFCSPALYGESFGIVLLEAMAMGTVTVAGNNLGYSSVLKERGKLSLVLPKQTRHFANRLELLLTDNEIRRLWQTWALKYVRQFSYDKVVSMYEAFYNHILQTAKLNKS